MTAARYIVGIDLGTTHTVVAFAEFEGQSPPEVFRVPQLVTAGEVEPRVLLPSFLYTPLPEEIPATELDEGWIVGEFARKRGVEVLGRGIASAKSWLCHSAVDRLAPILPWGADANASSNEDVSAEPTEAFAIRRLSPVAASTLILKHVARAWDASHPAAPLRQQTVILTVPASFDGVARELTVAAAQAAGLTVRLLEEPLAAFHDYLSRFGLAPLSNLLQAEPELDILVCDVGGGTTDLTLVRAQTGSGSDPSFTRSAVGRHLLLGGDNIDLALAHRVERRLLPPGEHLDPARFTALLMACRQAKEQLLSRASEAVESSNTEFPIRLLASGSSLVGSTLASSISRAELSELVLDGFLPFVRPGQEARVRRAGLSGFGLPYESDPAITRHVVAFLERHLGGTRGPGALLLNGGLFRAPTTRARLAEVLRQRYGRDIELLPGIDPDLAVARGAVAYGRELLGDARARSRVRAGASHGYYIGVGGAELNRLAICVVPRGALPEENHVCQTRPLVLRLGEPVRFELYASDTRPHEAPGTLVTIDDEQFVRLSPLVTRLQSPSENQREMRVFLEGKLSAIGTVELSCVEAATPSSTPAPTSTSALTSAQPAKQHYRLAFEPSSRPSESQRPPGRRAEVPHPRWDEAILLLDRVFGKSRSDVKPREIKDLLRELERVLGPRSQFSFEVGRAIADFLLERASARKRSPDHERLFWMLTGHGLRPGFGHPRDPDRLRGLTPLLGTGLVFQAEARGYQQFWIAWRRIAGGLDEPTQTELRKIADPWLAPAELKLKKPKGFKPQALDELADLSSWLERVPAESRSELGRYFLERTWTDRDPRIWTWIGRIGARVPAYASAHYVVRPSVIERWLDHLLREDWDRVPTAAETAAKLSRVSGDRARDLSEPVRQEVIRRLQRCAAPEPLIQMVREYVKVESSERAAWFEDLPVGLMLAEA
ncbi:MAG TPA: Hsp70 family protein [Polyangiaceae bacterium]|nr:Hsp70 family protein [Polyangiaceae bacterium]